MIEEPLFRSLAKKYHKTNVQILLRWHIQEGNIVFPRTTNPKHRKDNFDIFDFSLTEEEVKEIEKMGHTKRFYKVSLEDQEKFLGAWKRED